MASAVDICNLALSRIGDIASVQSIDPPEASAQAIHCARFYPVARDSMLERHPWGFATLRKTLKSIMAEHDDVVAALRAGNRAEFDRLIEVHILEYTRAVDYEALVEQLRRIEAGRKAG